jgi:hypothetical protein
MPPEIARGWRQEKKISRSKSPVRRQAQNLISSTASHYLSISVCVSLSLSLYLSKSHSSPMCPQPLLWLVSVPSPLPLPAHNVMRNRFVSLFTTWQETQVPHTKGNVSNRRATCGKHRCCHDVSITPKTHRLTHLLPVHLQLCGTGRAQISACVHEL